MMLSIQICQRETLQCFQAVKLDRKAMTWGTQRDTEIESSWNEYSFRADIIDQPHPARKPG